MLSRKTWIGFALAGLGLLVFSFQNCSQFQSYDQDSLFSNSQGTESRGPSGDGGDSVDGTSPIGPDFVPLSGDVGGPAAPVNLRQTVLTSTWVEMTWDFSGEEAAQYEIYRDNVLVDTVDMTYEQKGGVGEARVRYQRTRTFIDCNENNDEENRCEEAGSPVNGETYVYFVRAVDSQGLKSASSEPITVTFAPKVATPPDLNNYNLVLSEEFDDVQAGTLSQSWFFKRLWDQEAFRNVYNERSNSQQIINGENGYMVDPLAPIDPVNGNTEQWINLYSPFRSTENGILTIRAEPNGSVSRTNGFVISDTGGEAIEDGAFTHLTGLLRSKATFVNGYVEARMKLAGIHKFLSTFYLLNATYFSAPAPVYGEGEIDIMEYLGGGEAIYGTPERGRYVYQNYHYRSSLRQGYLHKLPGNRFGSPETPMFSDDFHVFSVLWEPGIAIYFVDGEEVFRVQGEAVSSDPKYIVIELVAGGEWANFPDLENPPSGPATLEIDYVRVYQNPNTPGNVFNP